MNNMSTFYKNVMEKGHLRTVEHAKRWTMATLRVTGHNLKRGARKRLAKALPDELAGEVRRMFWLVNLHEPALPVHEFQRQVALKVGATDGQFARHPIVAVFGELKTLIDQGVSSDVREALPAEVAELWQEA
jgi:uncharacterized protein (DUF2267 family)